MSRFCTLEKVTNGAKCGPFRTLNNETVNFFIVIGTDWDQNCISYLVTDLVSLAEIIQFAVAVFNLHLQ